MATSYFASLLEETAPFLGMKELKESKNGACEILFPNQVAVQLEVDETSRYLIISSVLGTVPPGRYRTQIMKEALKSNGMPHPRYGTVTFNPKNDMLFIFDRFPMEHMRGQWVAHFVTELKERALVWKEALNSGRVPILEDRHVKKQSDSNPPFFNFRR